MSELAVTESQDPEVEVILEGEGDAPSQGETPKGFLKRINKLNERVDDATARAERAEQERELLRMQLEQQKKPQGRPRPEDFDSDGAYQSAVDTFEDERLKRMREDIVKEVKKAIPTPQPDTSALEEHYKRAEQLGATGYEEAEDAVIEAVGKDLFKEIATSLPKSERVVYFLGKNPVKLREIADLLRTNPTQGTLALGELQGQLRLKRKETNPDPETEVHGADSSALSDEQWVSKIQKARESGKYTTKEIIAMKRQAREAGVTGV